MGTSRKLEDEAMSDIDGRPPEPADNDDKAPDIGPRNLALAVPLRAVERNRRVAATVLAGGFAYRIFLWLLPFGLILGGGLGFANAGSTEEAVEGGGIPAAVTNAIGDASRASQSNSWWLLAVGIPLLLWAGLSGAKAVQLIHALVWDEPPPKSNPLKMSLAFTGMVCAFLAAVALTWWVRGWWPGLLAPLLTLTPLAAMWLWASLHLPHRDAPWRALLPGALVVAIGFQVLHEAVGHFLVPKLEKSTSLYGDLGATTTFLFFMYITSILIVSAPVLNSSLYDELRSSNRDEPQDEGTTSPA